MFRSKALGLLCALLLAFPAEAQLAQTGAGKNPSGVAGYTGPLDVVGSAFACFSLRACSAATADGTHAATRLVRASDSHACDILLTTSGTLGNTSNCSIGGDNGTAVATWCNATTCTMDIWYDQVAGTNNASNGTVARQPTLTFSCVGSFPCSTWAADDLAMTNAAVNQPFSGSFVGKRTGNFTSQNDVIVGGTGFFFNNSANSIGGYFGSVAAVTGADSAWHQLQYVVNGASSTINIDGTANTGQNFGTVSGLQANSFLGDQASSTFAPMTGTLLEIIVWNNGVSLTGTQQTNLCHNQFAYWGSPLQTC